MPTGDNPKGPYPSGGETADKIGDYKIKVRTNRPTKDPVKPDVPVEEPDMEFVDPEISGGDLFDLEELGLSLARYVKIRDLSQEGAAPSVGFDLDAVGLIHFSYDIE